MKNAIDIRVLQRDATPRRISRRELAQAFLTNVAAAFLSPLSSAAHPLRKHLLSGSLLDFADAHLSGGARKPLFLSAQQLSALDALSEAIVPGSRQAQSADFIDLLLSADAHEVQQEFLGALVAVESASQHAYHTNVAALSQDQLRGLLTALSEAGSADHAHFNRLKDWIAGAYYSSEIGMRELGWTPDRVFPAFPGCSHADSHA
jgi:hypothetical protein